MDFTAPVVIEGTIVVLRTNFVDEDIQVTVLDVPIVVMVDTCLNVEVDEVARRLTYRVGARVPNGYFDAIAPITVEHNPFDTTHYAPSSSGGTIPPWERKRP